MSSADLGVRIVLEDGATAGLSALGMGFGRLPGLIQAVSYGFAGLDPTTKALGVTAGVAALAFGGIVGALMYTTKAAGSVQDTMANISVAVDGAAEHYNALRTTLVDVSNQSLYSDAQVGDSFVALGQRGQDATAIIGGVGLAAIQLAEATRSQTVPAADLLGQTLEIFHLKASDATQAATDLDFAFEHGIPSVSALQSAIAQVGPQADAMGVSLGDLMPVLSLLGQALGSGQKAGTALRYMLSTITDPTAKAQKALADLGLIAINQAAPAFRAFKDAVEASGTAGATAATHFDGTLGSLQKMFDAAQKVNALHTDKTFYQYALSAGFLSDNFYNAQGQFIGLKGAIDAIGQSIAKLPPADKAAALQQIFNVRGNQAIQALANDLPAIDTALSNLITTEQNYSVQQNAATKTNTLSGAMNRFKTNIFNLAASIGNSNVPFFQSSLSHLADTAGNLANNNHIGTFAGNALAAGAVLSGGLAGFTGLLFTTRALGNPANQKALGSIGQGFKNIFGEWGSTVFGPLEEGQVRAHGFIGAMRKLADTGGSVPDRLAGGFTRFGESINKFRGFVGPKVFAGFADIDSQLDAGKIDVFDAAILRFTKGFGNLGKMVTSDPLGFIAGKVKSFNSSMWAGFDKGFNFLLDGDIVGKLKSVGGAGFSALRSGVTSAIPAMLSFAGAALPIIAIVLLVAGAIAIGVLLFTKFHKQGQQIVDIFKSALAPTMTFLGKIFNDNLKSIQTEWNKMQPSIEKAMNSLVNGIHQAQPVFKLIATIIGAVIGLIIDAIGGLVRGFIAALPFIINVFANMFAFIGNIAHAIIALFHGDIPGALGFLGAAFGNLKDMVINLLQGMWSFVSGIFDGIKNGIKDVLKSMENIPGVGGLIKGGAQLFGVKGLAEGGVVTAPTLAVVGEGKEPEVVLPVSKLAAFMSNYRGGGGGGTTVVNNILDGKVISQSVVNHMTGEVRALGAGRMFR